jgi:activator of HSP90 ATPase
MATIKQRIVIQASSKEVYDVYMNEEKHSQFTGSKASINPTVGGEFTAWDGYIYGINLELETGKKIVQEWRTSEWPEGKTPSRLEITLKNVKNGTELVIVHHNVPKEQLEDLKQGWIDFYWEPLKKYFSKSPL